MEQLATSNSPPNKTVAQIGAMISARVGHSVTRIGAGVLILIAGGQDDAGNYLATAEIYNPATGIFTPTGNLITARAGHTATSLLNGQVLIAGGTNSGGLLSSVEIFSPGSGTFIAPSGPRSTLTTARSGHAAALMADGRILITGGADAGDAAIALAELYSQTS